MPKRVAVVEVTLDGRQDAERARRNRARHGGQSDDAGGMIAKARDLIVPVLGADKFERLVEKLFALEKVQNVQELRPLIQTA